MSQQVAEKRQPEAKQAQIISTTLVARRRLSPSFVRLTLAGGGLGSFEYRGYDQWFRLFLPREGPEQLCLPTSAPDPLWYSQFRATPEEQRPCMRYVTVREYRQAGPSGPEIDVDVVVHGEPNETGAGPLSNWAQTAEPGQQVGVLDQGHTFRPDAAAAGVMLLGDETAVPAIAGILCSLSPETRGRAVIEVPRPDDVQPLTGPPGIAVSWLTRQDAATLPGELVLAAAREHLAAGERQNGASDAPHRRPYVYAAGESAMIKSLNQLLRQDLAWPSELFTTVGYWHNNRDGHA